MGNAINEQRIYKGDNPGEQESGERGIFDFEVNDEQRFLYFAGTKEDVMDFMSRLMACSIATDPDRAKYAWRREQYKPEIERHADEWLQDTETIQNSYALTFEPFRLYLLPADRAPEYLLGKFKETATGKKWFVKMMTNSPEYNDEQRQRTWKEVKDNFERVRQEMAAERGVA